MRVSSAVTAALSGLASLGHAHMEMKSPPPLRSKFNAFTTDIDYDMTSPLSAAGADFPCKGYHKLVGTPQGQPVATWSPGGSYSMTITGQTPHNGGSCQASLSFDGGRTWKVLHSYVGNCPVMGASTYPFSLPRDTPAGKALFAWTWFNKVGNREMYMNCASVTVAAGGSDDRARGMRGASDPYDGRPAMFVANVGNGCSTVEGRDLLFPRPGPDVSVESAGSSGAVGICGSRDEMPTEAADGSSTSALGPGASAVSTWAQLAPYPVFVTLSTRTKSVGAAETVAAKIGGGGGGSCAARY
ncbi:uncharacterized protein UV8b_05323 [Ustilaginoidea virens]|uniref:Extracellular protein n=1 Tax=Ustilaginoidea virens TaxID=1159556 RepID=A0A8E5HSZ9_USTVR|nr:uncharacterized protein UV8b_05323 [Ustilaginoidea virens]QUC21080.1 hypothetical protein UV8b_05323 [Ustilaginoidea virens]